MRAKLGLPAEKKPGNEKHPTIWEFSRVYQWVAFRLTSSAPITSFLPLAGEKRYSS
jgi:hypothetical protein